jgi:signal recognition particle subunit SEC65
MPRTRFSATDLSQLERQLTRWRRSRRQGRRLPEGIWAAAVKLVRTHGLSRVARRLRLDYYQLQRRASPPVRPPTSEPVAACPEGFVELPWRASAPGPMACRVELRDPQGATMTLHLPGATAVVAALAEAFWRRS